MLPTQLIPIETARHHLRLDGPDDDTLVALYLGAAVDSAQEFLNRRVYPDAESMAAAVLDGSAGADPMLITDAIRAGILLILGHLYTNREDVGGVALAALPRGSRELLAAYRVGWGV